ncbi:hypothetical protein Tbd_2809 [Thiobacillus denitrificans ATCC 25259]|uniref:Ice-binding protein C-terminal domain-containing protein n=1 Tax=Thiobacillus denitrificans (strain ATCC 25259 / T1) TaxID=292415 RepID=Q3SF54_THIDA|nr:PEP-CTERM sorting domain-containing protein [Thiobacillus denitrificans]AAZ98762.1 hypothetical protein Tbd_2809 [Thiobacillus denitrificans ATCC 25259]
MKGNLASLLAASTLLLYGPSYGAYATKGSVYMISEPGNYVGAGMTQGVTWVHGVDGLFSESVNYDKGASITYNGDSWFYFDFAAPTYNPSTNTTDGNYLAVGRYDNATRFPFNSPTKPGLDVSGDGRGNNQLSGWFEILEVEYDVSKTHIQKLAVDFTQYGENLTQSGPGLFGSLRFNSDVALTIPSAVPEPSTYLTMALGIGLVALATRRRKAASEV